jgi:hypothetical protein
MVNRYLFYMCLRLDSVFHAGAQFIKPAAHFLAQRFRVLMCGNRDFCSGIGFSISRTGRFRDVPGSFENRCHCLVCCRRVLCGILGSAGSHRSLSSSRLYDVFLRLLVLDLCNSCCCPRCRCRCHFRICFAHGV